MSRFQDENVEIALGYIQESIQLTFQVNPPYQGGTYSPQFKRYWAPLFGEFPSPTVCIGWLLVKPTLPEHCVAARQAEDGELGRGFKARREVSIC